MKNISINNGIQKKALIVALEQEIQKECNGGRRVLEQKIVTGEIKKSSREFAANTEAEYRRSRKIV